MLMAERVGGTERITLGADKAYDTKEFVSEMRGMNVTPHVSLNIKRSGGSAIDGRTTRHAGYQVYTSGLNAHKISYMRADVVVTP
jgi:hypothetical protein